MATTQNTTNCHCGADFKGSDHCPQCFCEQHESTCDAVCPEGVRVATDGDGPNDWVVTVCGVRRFRGNVFAACRFANDSVTVVDGTRAEFVTGARW